MRIAICLIAAAAIGGIASGAQAAEQDFALHNDTGYTIDKVFVSPVSKSSWGPDILGRDQLEDGQGVNITFRESTTACRWDLKVVYEDKDEAIWNDVNLCEISNVHLHWDRKSGVTRASAD
jgi:hypothetical protein